METKLQPSITGTRVNLIKGASQKDINDNTNLTKQYMDETKAYRDEANIINNSIAILNDETIYNADMAYKWSSNPIEVEVTTGKYSAYHWAYKANEAANIAINIIDDINISTLKSYSNSKVNDLLGDKAFLNNPKFTNHISFGNSILSNWAGSLKVIEANGSTFFGSNGISALTGSNAYYDGNWRYKTDGSAGLQLVNQGSHQFIVAASGLSNDIISWNTILTVDNNGVNSDSLVNKTSQTGSIIMPSSSTLNRDNVPLDGYTRHNTTLKNLEYYGNSKWNIITDNLKIVNSVSELKLLDGNVYVNCIVNGYYIKGDGGGGNFYWDSSSTETDNGGTIIQATGVVTGRWKRIINGDIEVEMFGAYRNNTNATITTNAIQKAIDYSYPLFKNVKGDGEYLINSQILIPSYRTTPPVSLDFTIFNIFLNKVTYTENSGTAIRCDSSIASINIKQLIGSNGDNTTIGFLIYGQGNTNHRIDYVSGFGINVKFEESYTQTLTLGYCQNASVGVWIEGNHNTILSGRIGGQFSYGTVLTDNTTCDIGVKVISGVANKIYATIEYCKRTSNSICLYDSAVGTYYNGYIESGAKYNIYAIGKGGIYDVFLSTNSFSKTYIEKTNKINLKSQDTSEMETVTGANSSLEFQVPNNFISNGFSSIEGRDGYEDYQYTGTNKFINNLIYDSNYISTSKWAMTSIGSALWSSVTTDLNATAFEDANYMKGTKFTFPALSGRGDIYKISQSNKNVYYGAVNYGAFVKVISGEIDILIRLVGSNKQSRQVIRLSASDKWSNIKHKYMNTEADASNITFEIQFRTDVGASIIIANTYLVNAGLVNYPTVTKSNNVASTIKGIPVKGNTFDNGININGAVKRFINNITINASGLYLSDFMQQPIVVIDGGWTGNLFLTGTGNGNGHTITLKRTNVAATGVMQILPSGTTIDGSSSALDIAPINKVVTLIYSELKNTWFTI